MKKQILILVMSLFALTVMAEKTKKVVTFHVPLDCENCVAKVEQNIAFEKGVKDLSCDLAKKTVTITYLDEKTTVEALKKGFAKIGYDDVKLVERPCCSAKKEKEKCCKDKAKKDCCSDKKSAEKPCCNDKESTKEKGACCKK